MYKMLDMSDVILAKSDQLNAEDLIASPMILNVTGVKKINSDTQPVFIDYEGGEGRPYKPCKGMVKALSALWSLDGHEWIGKSIRVYMEPSAVYAGKETGGIRINGLSHIDSDKKVTVSESRFKKVTYLIEKLDIEQKQRAAWPDDKFNPQFDKMKTAIETGKSTVDSIVTFLQKTADLTQSQIDRLNSVELIEQQSDDDFFGEGE